jgi:hypothetical protein
MCCVIKNGTLTKMRSVKRKIYSKDETPVESKSKELKPELELSHHKDWFCTGIIWFHVFTSLD